MSQIICDECSCCGAIGVKTFRKPLSFEDNNAYCKRCSEKCGCEPVHMVPAVKCDNGNFLSESQLSENTQRVFSVLPVTTTIVNNDKLNMMITTYENITGKCFTNSLCLFFARLYEIIKDMSYEEMDKYLRENYI